MKVAILSAVLGNFDTLVDPVEQQVPDIAGEKVEVFFHRFTDEDFPPIADLPPRFQYRIPKMFGFDMFPGHDIYIWLDGTFSFDRPDAVEYFLRQLWDKDMVVFKHPWRNTAQEETDHIEEHLLKEKPYITARYKNGFHKEQMAEILKTPSYVDDELFTSTAFVYRNTSRVRAAFIEWWLQTSRFFTVDQIAMPYVLRKHGLQVTVIPDNQYKFKYLKIASEHK